MGDRTSVARMHGYFVIATLPAVIVALSTQPPGTRVAFATAGVALVTIVLATSFAWHLAFAVRRKRPLDSGWLMHGWLFCLLVPATLPLPQAMLGISVGVVIGSLVFGGTGRYLVSPALLGVVVLSLNYPHAFYDADAALLWSQLKTSGLSDITNGWRWLFVQESATLGGASVAACGLGAILLYRAGAASLRIVGGALGGAWLGAWLLNLAGGPWHNIAEFPIYWHWASAPFCFAVAFIATDPTAAAVTPLGRWVYGGLIGFLSVTLRILHPEHPEATLAACLLASLFAPLIDQCCLRVKLRRRRTENLHAIRP